MADVTEEAYRYLQALPDKAVVDKITHLNAMRIFRFDPFSMRPPEKASVGSLREEVAGRDVTFNPGRQRRWAMKSQAETHGGQVIAVNG